jgi:hypothetical protein
MSWVMVNDFTVVERKEDGTVTQQVFTSHAQARQFMEKYAGQKPMRPHKPTMPSHARARSGSSKPIIPQTAEQIALREAALKQFNGL